MGVIQKPTSPYDSSVARLVDAKDIVGANEIAKRLNCTFPSIVHSWQARHKDFPKPLTVITAGKLWDWKEIEAWARKTKRIR